MQESFWWSKCSDRYIISLPPPSPSLIGLMVSEDVKHHVYLLTVVSEEVLAGTEIPGGGGRGRLYLTLHCHHQNDSALRWAATGANLMFH